MSAVRFRAALLVITLGAFALRTYGLGAQSFWLDEVDAITLASSPLLEQLHKLSSIGENGPLYFVLFKGWLAAAGTSEFGARYLSTLASTAAVPLAGALAYRLLADAPVALLTALLAATSPYYVWYAQDAKMYPLFALLALAAQYCFLRGWGLPFVSQRSPAAPNAAGQPGEHGSPTRRASPAWWAGYVICSSLALYVHLFAVLQIAAGTLAGLWLWRWAPRSAGRWGFALATFVLIAPYLPLAAWEAPVLLRGANVGYAPASLKTIAIALLEQLTWHLNPPPDRRWLIVLGALGLWGLWRSTQLVPVQATGLVRHSLVDSLAVPNTSSETARGRAAAGSRLPAPGVLVLWLLVPVAGTLALQRTVPVFRDRYLIPLLAPWLVLLACAARPPTARRAGGALAQSLSLLSAGFVAAGFGYGLAHRPPNPDFRAAAGLIREAIRPGDEVGFLAEYAQRPFDFYYHQAPGDYVKVALPYTNYPDLSERDGLLAVARSLRGGRRLWVVRFEPWLWDSRGLVDQYLANRGATASLRRDFNGVSVTLYELP